MICIKTAKSDAVKGGACEGWHNTAFCVHGAEPEDNFDEACWEVAEGASARGKPGHRALTSECSPHGRLRHEVLVLV
jgi:hypothetical protein